MQTIRDMKENLVKALDVPSWAREHPWIVVGSAAALGAVTGAVITSALDRNAAAEERARLAARVAALPEDCAYPARRRRRAASLAGFVAGTLGNVFRTLVQSSISAATAAAVAKEHVEASEDSTEASD